MKMKTMNNFIMSAVASIVLAGAEAKADFMQCLQCPAGYKCDGINKTPCPAGYISSAGASECYSCEAGQYVSNNTCQNCADGYYQPNKNQTSCLSCDDLYVRHIQSRKNEFFGINDTYFNGKKSN